MQSGRCRGRSAASAGVENVSAASKQKFAVGGSNGRLGHWTLWFPSSGQKNKTAGLAAEMMTLLNGVVQTDVLLAVCLSWWRLPLQNSDEWSANAESASGSCYVATQWIVRNIAPHQTGMVLMERILSQWMKGKLAAGDRLRVLSLHWSQTREII